MRLFLQPQHQISFGNWLERSHSFIKSDCAILIGLTLATSVIFYLPYWIDGTIDLIFRYWDGPNYSFLAKSLYSVAEDHPLNPYTTADYFAAHLPLYPLSIRALAFIGYNYAMIVATLLYTIGATLILYRLLVETHAVKYPLWSAFLSLFLPARYLIYHNVGATEPAFIFFTLASLLAYIRGYYILAFALGGLAGITRITGILLGASYAIHIATQRKWSLFLYLPLIVLPLLLTFVFYHFHYSDFFAYFNVNLSESNALIQFSPFDIFIYYSSLEDSHSAEFYLALYAVYGAGVCMLWNKNTLLFVYALVSYIFSLFIFHQDLSRYLIPIAPLALVIGYDDILSKQAVRYATPLFIFLVYLYAWSSIPHNLIEDWVYEDLLLYLSN